MSNDRLKSVCLNNCRNVTDDSLVGINSDTGKRLLEIELMGCDQLHHSIAKTVQLCPNLMMLNLRGVSLVCDETILALAKSCPFVEHLDVSAQSIRTTTSTNSFTPRIGFKGMQALGDHCHKLRILRCNGCIRLDDECITVVAEGCPLLEELALKNCFRITDQAVTAVGEHCKAMKHIILSSCREISDVGIVNLSVGCFNLEIVNLAGLTHITDNSVVHMAINCKLLKRVNLRGCYKLSDKTLVALAELCLYLEDIDLYGVDSLTDKSIGSINFNSSMFRSLDVGNTEVTEAMLKKLSKDLYCSFKIENKLVLEPLHSRLDIHRQHSKVRIIPYIAQV